MKGNNELHLNTATIIEAVQEYLNKRMTSYSPKVVNVTRQADTFIVSTQQDDDKIKAIA